MGVRYIQEMFHNWQIVDAAIVEISFAGRFLSFYRDFEILLMFLTLTAS